MKRTIIVLIVIMLLTSGCGDKTYIEDVSLSLLIGIDLDEENNLVFSTSSPVFNKEAKVKEEYLTAKTTTLRKSREENDKTFMALNTGEKTQVILIGKRVMEHEGWYKLLEPLLRDPKNTVTPKIVMVDGPAYEVIRYTPTDKPRIPMYLTKLIETAARRNINVLTTLQDLRRQTLDKGITASVTELRKEKRLYVTGSALIDDTGKYKLSIGPDETKLLRILQHRTTGDFPFTVHEQSKPKHDIFPDEALSFSAAKISVDTKTDYQQNRFTFDVKVKMSVVLTERLFPLDVRKEEPKLERIIEQQMEQKFLRFIQKIQAAQVDPVGFGIYARAFQYKHWKPVQEHWGNAFSEADCKVKVQVEVAGMGQMK